MDWTKQTEEMVKSWTDVQKKMLDQWLAPIKSLAASQPEGAAAGEYLKGLEAWEAAVRKALDAQAQWARMWGEGLTTQKAPGDAMAAWAGQTQEMIKAWTDSNKQLWDHWLSAVQKVNPASSGATEAWKKQSESVMKAWQDAADTAQKTMSDWAAQWSKKEKKA